jgi:hypothetical protein
MKAARWIGTLVLGFTLVGCATIISGSDQLLTVNSNVQGAEVYLNDQMLGTTPLSVSVKRGQEGILRVQAEGHQPYQVALNRDINTVFFVNILSGGVFGSTTDYSTGAMYKYEPSTFFASLQPGQLSMAERRSWERREGLRAYVLMNHQAIVTDLAAGEGEHMDVLASLLAVGPEDRTEALQRWRAAYQEGGTALRFAERMISELD